MCYFLAVTSSSTHQKSSSLRCLASIDFYISHNTIDTNIPPTVLRQLKIEQLQLIFMTFVQVLDISLHLLTSTTPIFSTKQTTTNNRNQNAESSVNLNPMEAKLTNVQHHRHTKI